MTHEPETMNHAPDDPRDAAVETLLAQLGAQDRTAARKGFEAAIAERTAPALRSHAASEEAPAVVASLPARRWAWRAPLALAASLALAVTVAAAFMAARSGRPGSGAAGGPAAVAWEEDAAFVFTLAFEPGTGEAINELSTQAATLEEAMSESLGWNDALLDGESM